MTVTACPYCGSAMNAPLKFCVSCGRAVAPGDNGRLGGLKTVTKPGITKRLDDNVSASSFDRAKKSYGNQRTVRNILLNISYVLAAILAFYFMVRVLIK